MFDDDVWRYSPVGPTPTLAIGLVGLGLLVYVARTRARALSWGLLAMTVLGVLVLTARGTLGNDDGGFSWRLGHTITSELHNINRELGLVNVFGNVLMFVPFGWLVAVLAPRRRVLVGGLFAAGLSVAIEVWQMLSGSFGDIDDVVLNTAGGLLGAVAAMVAGAGTRSQDSVPAS